MPGDQIHSLPPSPQPQMRPAGGTEQGWCRAVPTGTGVTVLSLLLTKPPDSSALLSAIRRLQITHPILRSKLHSTRSFSFLIPPDPHLAVSTFDIEATAQILRRASEDSAGAAPSPFQLIIEHEMGKNPWGERDRSEWDVLYASVYALGGDRWAVALRLHNAVCDLVAGAALLRELTALLAGNGNFVTEEGVNPEIEKLMPTGKKQRIWARGLNMLGYSLNAFRMSQLDFVVPARPRTSQLVCLRLNSNQTRTLLTECKSRGVKLCAALSAAALIAGHSSKGLPGSKREKYAVVTLVDCRSTLEPALPAKSAGFYHSAILNSHEVSNGEKFWDLAKRTYKSYATAKDHGKHLSDLGDLNFLMCRAIDNPGLTPSGAMRTAFVSVFEDSIISESSPLLEEIGLDDYMCCSSVHGIGPSIAIYDALKDGQLDCACVYPSPLHSRDQMTKLVDDMRKILIESGC